METCAITWLISSHKFCFFLPFHLWPGLYENIVISLLLFSSVSSSVSYRDRTFNYPVLVRQIRTHGKARSASFMSLLYCCNSVMVMLIPHFVLCLISKRIWARAPLIGTRLARFTQTYFLSTLLVIFAVAASYLWAGFQFNNVCLGEKQFIEQPTFFA